MNALELLKLRYSHCSVAQVVRLTLCQAKKNPEPKGSGINPPMMVEETKGA
jgi:hypothetical protein